MSDEDGLCDSVGNIVTEGFCDGAMDGDRVGALDVLGRLDGLADTEGLSDSVGNEEREGFCNGDEEGDTVGAGDVVGISVVGAAVGVDVGFGVTVGSTDTSPA